MMGNEKPLLRKYNYSIDTYSDGVVDLYSA